MAGLVIDDPITLTNAVSSNRVLPGDTILLDPGTYSGKYFCCLTGTIENPVTIKPRSPGDRVTIDGSFSFIGANHVIFQDIELTNTSWKTRTYQVFPELISPNSYILSSTGVRIINCIIHDGSQCVVNFGGGFAEMYGCLLYNGGVTAGGHTIYTHNNPGTYTLFENNIWLASYNYGFHAHSSGANNIDNYDLKDNIFGKCNGKHTFGNDSGLDTKIRNIVFRGNESMGTWWWFNRWTTPTADDFTITENWFDGSNINEPGCCKIKSTKKIVFTGNTLVYPGNLLYVKCPNEVLDYTINSNVYYGAGDGAFPLQQWGDADYVTKTFAEWQALGYDAASSFATTTPANRIRLLPNKYDADRAHLAIYNYSLADSVTVDVSSIYADDDVIAVHQAQDYFNDIQNLTVASGSIIIDMRAVSHTAIAPIAGELIDPLMLPKYGAFVLIKT